jgi:putative FmdB family regulatory protein
MPTYDFQCGKCGRVHEIFRRFSDKLPERMKGMNDPCCHGNVKVSQIFSAPGVVVKSSALTLGQLAEKNAKSMGKSQVEEISEKYRTKKQDVLKLKKGMSVDRRGAVDKKSMDRINKINNMSDTQKKRFIEKGQ